MRLVHGDGAEPGLPEMPGPPWAPMDRAGISAMHARQGAPEAVPVLRHEDQMDVIGHQAPGPDLDVGSAAEEIAIERIVIATEERLLPAVAALGDMVRDTGNDDPGETGHARTSAVRATHGNKMHCHRNPL